MKDTTHGHPSASTGLRPRVLYFAVFIFFSLSGGRFTATFLEHELNFSQNWMISTAMAVQILASSSCSSWLGGLADSLEAKGRRNGRLQIMASGLLLSTVATLLHRLGRRLWMPPSLETDNDYTENDVQNHQYLPMPLLAYHLFLRTIYAIGTTACSPVLDGLTLARLEHDARDSSEYGKERLYGAVSWGIANVFFGPAIDKWGFGIIYTTTTLSFITCIISFYVYAKSNQMPYASIDENDLESIRDSESHNSLRTTRARKYKTKTSDTYESEDSHQQQQMEHKLKVLSTLTKKNGLLNLSYVVAMFTLYIGMSVVENLIFLYFEYLGGSYSMMGLTVAVTVMFELPLFHFAPDVLRRLQSPVWMFQAGCAAYVIRVLVYSLIPQDHPYWTLAVEPFHGVTVGFVLTASVAFAAEWVPKGYEASGQGFLSMIRGLGQFVGLCIGGFLDGRILYRVLAVVVSVGSVMLAIGEHITTNTPMVIEEDGSAPVNEQKNKQELQLVPSDEPSDIQARE
jgi:hypothetical protein